MLCLPALLPAQGLDPDEEGCKDSPLLTRMPMCRISECSTKEFDSADAVVGIKDDEAVAKTLEGKKEFLLYECSEKASPLQMARNMEAAVRKTGYKVIFSGKVSGNEHTVTVQNGAQWLEFRSWYNGETPYYQQTAVLVQQMQQNMVATADAWAAEIEKSGRVAVYGINFDTAKSTLKPDAEPVLNEIVKLLGEHADWNMRIEGHTDNVGAKAANAALSEKRAAAVVSWLAAHGVAKTRLTAQGFGDTKPAADNTTEEGRAKNRRVELVKL